MLMTLWQLYNRLLTKEKFLVAQERPDYEQEPEKKNKSHSLVVSGCVNRAPQ